MKYRSFGKHIDFQPSALGFGAMRLPIIGEDSTNIEEKEATRMIRYAIDNGVNYIDTAYPYHGGASEPFIGRALSDGYRDKVRIASKMPSWKIEKQEDLDACLEEQLERLGDEHIDFYLLHALNSKFWENYKKVDVFEWIEKVKRQGKIDHIGFSFHDEYPVFNQILNEYDGWEFCQIQYNYMDREYQAGEKGLKEAAEKGLGIVVMEPLRGGLLAHTPPAAVQEIWKETNADRTPAEWALQWLWDQEEVSVVISGMSNFEQTRENVEAAARSGIGILKPSERELFDRVEKTYLDYMEVPCTQCGYCTPCPQGVNIPRIFELYNARTMYRDKATTHREYISMSPDSRADKCTECGECEEACPQNIAIMEWLKTAGPELELAR